MKTKGLVLFSLAAILVFLHYDFPDSFADNSNGTSSSANNVNAVSSTPAPPSASTVQSNATIPQSVSTTQPSPTVTQPISTTAKINSTDSQSVSTTLPDSSKTTVTTLQNTSNQPTNTVSSPATASSSNTSIQSSVSLNQSSSQSVTTKTSGSIPALTNSPITTSPSNLSSTLGTTLSNSTSLSVTPSNSPATNSTSTSHSTDTFLASTTIFNTQTNSSSTKTISSTSENATQELSGTTVLDTKSADTSTPIITNPTTVPIVLNQPVYLTYKMDDSDGIPRVIEGKEIISYNGVVQYSANYTTDPTELFRTSAVFSQPGSWSIDFTIDTVNGKAVPLSPMHYAFAVSSSSTPQVTTLKGAVGDCIGTLGFTQDAVSTSTYLQSNTWSTSNNKSSNSTSAASSTTLISSTSSVPADSWTNTNSDATSSATLVTVSPLQIVWLTFHGSEKTGIPALYTGTEYIFYNGALDYFEDYTTDQSGTLRTDTMFWWPGQWTIKFTMDSMNGKPVIMSPVSYNVVASPVDPSPNTATYVRTVGDCTFALAFTGRIVINQPSAIISSSNSNEALNSTPTSSTQSSSVTPPQTNSISTPTSSINDLSTSSPIKFVSETLPAPQLSNQNSLVPLEAQPSVIPGWIKATTNSWSQGQVKDQAFVIGMQYLIQNGIVKIPQDSQSASGSSQIPTWIKNNANWWANGQISDNDFVNGIQYMISNGIIQLNA